MLDEEQTDLIPIAHVARSLRVGLRTARDLCRKAEALTPDGIDCAKLLSALELPATCRSRMRMGAPMLLTGQELARRMGLTPRAVQTYAAGIRRPAFFPVGLTLVGNRKLFLVDDVITMEFHAQGIETGSSAWTACVNELEERAVYPNATLGCAEFLEDLEGLIPPVPSSKRVRKK